MATVVAPLLCPPLSDRPGLLGGLAFLEGGTAEWGIRDLRAWFSEHLIEPGYMGTPLVVTETSTGTVPLYGHDAPSTGQLAPLLGAARTRVLGALRGLVASPVDDRFLAATVFAGRVRRERVRGASRWVARPDRAAPLSGVVLSLFAMDALSHRETYDRLLTVCDTCDRVLFHEGARGCCPDHLPSARGVGRKAEGDHATPPMASR